MTPCVAARCAALRIKFVIDMLVDHCVQRNVHAPRANDGEAVNRQHDQHHGHDNVVLIAPARQNAGSLKCIAPTLPVTQTVEI
jgi:hypothetical protein